MKNYIKLLALFSGLAGFSLLSLSFFWIMQTGGKTDFYSVFTDPERLSHEQLSLYSFQLGAAFSIVSIYLIGHFAMWLGYSLIIYRENKLLSYVLVVIGFLSAITDFTEYSIRLAILELIRSQIFDNQLMFGFWLIVRQLSIWLIFLGSMLAALAAFNKKFGKMILLLALLGLITIPIMYIPGVTKIWYLWLITWHFAACIFLWKTSIDQ